MQATIVTLWECKARKFHHDLLLIETVSAISGLSMVKLRFRLLKINDLGMEQVIDGRERAHHKARQRDDRVQERNILSHDFTILRQKVTQK